MTLAECRRLKLRAPELNHKHTVPGSSRFWQKSFCLRVTEVLRPYMVQMVARGGIEPPTRGFSVRDRKLVKCMYE
jgi:hypothetical protein